jgi:hypothetical protein
LPSAQYHYGEALKAITDAVPEDFGWSLLPDLPPDKLPAVYKLGKNRDEFGTRWHVTSACGIRASTSSNQICPNISSPSQT